MEKDLIVSNVELKRADLTREEYLIKLNKVAHAELEKERILRENYPTLKVSYCLGDMHKRELSNLVEWINTPMNIYRRTRDPALSDEYIMENNFGQKMIPGFNFKRGYAFWENAWYSGDEITAPQINFIYSFLNLENKAERYFVINKLDNLKESIFEIIKNKGKDLEDHEWMMKNNYFMDLEVEERKNVNAIHLRGNPKYSQKDNLKKFFEKIDKETGKRSLGSKINSFNLGSYLKINS